MVKVLEGIPVSVVVVVLALAGCSGKFSVSCGNASYSTGDDPSKPASVKTGSLIGIARITKSTFPGLDPSMQCKVTIEKKLEKELGDGQVTCFAGNNIDGGLLVYSGHAVLEAEVRGEGTLDDRILWIDESKDVRARIEYDGKRAMKLSVRIWSTNATWMIEAEAEEVGS